MPAGRPTKYRIEYCTEAAKLCFMFGATDVQLAEWFNVDVTSIVEWRNVHPEFSMAIKPSKESYDARIERSLAERAMGYSCTETVTASFQGKITDKKEVEKHYPPDPTTIIFWLTNRQRDKWKRNMVDVDPTEQVATPLNITFNVAAPAADIKITNAAP